MLHKIIAVYGNSYKTTTAINLAELITRRYPKAAVAFVSIDDMQPALPLIFPKISSDNSFGKLMSQAEDMDGNTILAMGQPAKSNLAVYGYNTGENINSYAKPIDTKIDDLYMYMRSIFDFTVIDCTKDVMGNKYTAKALINADVTVNLVSCDIYGLVFFDSQKPILEHSQYHYERFINCLTLNGAFEQDTMDMSDLLSAKYVIPYSKKVAETINMGLAFEKVPDKNYRSVLSKIIDEIVGEKSAEDLSVQNDD